MRHRLTGETASNNKPLKLLHLITNEILLFEGSMHTMRSETPSTPFIILGRRRWMK